MTNNNNSGQTVLEQRVLMGKEYKEDFTFELYGDDVTVALRPLDTSEYLPLLGEMANSLGIETSEVDVEDVEDNVDALGEELRVEDLNDEFVDVMERAGARGIVGAYDEEGELHEFSEQRCTELVGDMKGSAPVELGSRVLELSDEIEDAEKFR